MLFFLPAGHAADVLNRNRLVVLCYVGFGACYALLFEIAHHDIVAQGETSVDDSEAARALVAGWAEAGCTWWLETRWEMPHGAAERMRQVRERLAARPPRPA